jgi:hypothetical protein
MTRPDPINEMHDTVRAVLEDVARPALDLATGVLEATDLEDDADLGRRVRELVRIYATTRIDRELERSARNQAGSDGAAGRSPAMTKILLVGVILLLIAGVALVLIHPGVSPAHSVAMPG